MPAPYFYMQVYAGRRFPDSTYCVIIFIERALFDGYTVYVLFRSYLRLSLFFLAMILTPDKRMTI